MVFDTFQFQLKKGYAFGFRRTGLKRIAPLSLAFTYSVFLPSISTIPGMILSLISLQMPLWVFQPKGSPLASSLLLNSVMVKKSCEYILEVNVNEQKKKMVKITCFMKIHCIDIPTQGVETRKNTPLPLSRGEFQLVFNSFPSSQTGSNEICSLSNNV